MAESIKQCYGNRLECARRGKCSHGEVCLSRAREKAEDVHFGIQNVSVHDIQFDPNADAEAELESIYYDTPREEESEYSIELEGVKIPEESVPPVMRVIERLAVVYFETPVVFDSLMHRIFKGMKQADIARAQNVTRQAVHKRLQRELGIDQKRNSVQERRDRELAAAKLKFELAEQLEKEKDQFIREMSKNEFAVYKLCFVDGCSVRSAALQLNIRKSRVHQIGQSLRRKLNKNRTGEN